MTLYDSLITDLPDVSPWNPENEAAVMEPFNYLISNPGKDMMPRFVAAFNLWLDVPPAARGVIANAVTMVHDASLLIDDIEDDSDLRRGKPVAHSVFGAPRTINAATQAYLLAQQEILSLDSGPESQVKLINAFTDEFIAIHRGQGLELLWRETLRCPSEEEYVHMANGKTGGFLRMTVKLMMVCATKNLDVDYLPLTNLIGIFYQIRDDVQNLFSATYSKSKGVAEDLTEGKFSFPIVHGIHANPSDMRILDTLKQRPTTPSAKLPIIEYLKTETRSLEYTLGVLAKLEHQARMEVARLGGNLLLEKFLDAVHVDEAVLGENRDLLNLNKGA
ncbi:isoprenoid synthase domain-containing protein [Favolaschia claudopus]|uniref:(2E,6E)-farnesyl diphosphate synthase n=1 Tax=Favolaschia claudopus TaxID=2862362 RepID=A0AAW0DY66_9AGAR